MLERFSCPRRPTAHPFESPVRRHVTLKSSPPVSGAQCRNTVRTTKKAHCQHSALYILAERKGLEPSASGVTGRRYNRLNYRSGWWAVQDLNLWPPPCKGGAQPTELTAHHSRSLTRYVRQRQAARRGSGLIPVFFFSSRCLAASARRPGVVACAAGWLSFFPFLSGRWLAASARRPGVVACAAGWLSFFPFLSGRWLAASARRPGVVACTAGGRGQGLAQPLAPYNPVPRVRAALPDGQHGYAKLSPHLLPAARQRAIGLPLSRVHAGRASVRRRSFRPFRGGDLLRALPRLRRKTLCRAVFPRGDSRSRTPEIRLSFADSAH